MSLAPMKRIAQAERRPADESVGRGGHALADGGRALLGQFSLFRRLSAAERAALLARARVQEYAAQETIFLMDSPGDSMVAVLSGTIRISVPSADGKEVVLAILGPGEICGEIALLDGKERTADARAATDCSVVVLERRDVLSFFAQHPDAWVRLIEVLCDRLRAADQQMAEFALLPVPMRLAKALLRLATPAGQAENGHAAAHVHLTQRELGNVIGATRESVNKYLRAWQRKGCLRLADRLIVITNRAALEGLAQPKD
jgi:CRP-like cAMP-binding protein